MNVANHFGSTAVLALLLIASTLTAAPIPFAGVAGISAMERAEIPHYCATCHFDDPAPKLVRYKMPPRATRTPTPTIRSTGTIVGGRALPASLWQPTK